jgi:hypothetical protein
MIASCFHAAGARGSIHVVEPIVLHALGGCAADEPLAALLGDGLRAPAHIRPDVGRFARVVAAVSGPTSALAEAGADLPAGAAHAEAVALRLQRAGGAMSWGEPQPVASVTALLQLSRERPLVRRDSTRRCVSRHRPAARRLVRHRLARARAPPGAPLRPAPAHEHRGGRRLAHRGRCCVLARCPRRRDAW